MKLRTIPTKRLTQRLTAAGLSLYLNNIEDWDGNDITSSEVPALLYAVLRNSSRTQLELIEIDGTTIANAAITITKRALGYEGGITADVETAYDWDSNETYCEIGSNPPQLLDNMVDKDRAQTITGIKTYTASPIVPTPTTDYQASTKKYADDLAIAGAPDGTVTVKGIYELATIAEASANAAAGSGGTTAALTITTALTSNTSAAAQIIPVTDADGDIPVEFMELDADWAFTGNNSHSGTETFTGTAVDMTAVTSVTVPTPTLDAEAATKLYVDQKSTNSYTAENTVDEGDLLYISSANKVKRYSPESGSSLETATAVNAGLTGAISKVIKMTDILTCFVAGGGQGTAGVGKIQAGSLNAAETDFDYGTVADFTDGDVSDHVWDTCKLTDTKTISLQRTDEATDQLVAVVHTFVSTAITIGTEVAIEATSTQTNKEVRIARISDTQAIAGYTYSGGSRYAALMVLDIATATVTTNTVYESANANLDEDIVGLIMWDAATGMLVGNKGGGGIYAQLFSIAGTVVTWGNSLTIDATGVANGSADLITLSSTKAVVKWRSAAATVQMATITTDGTDITLGTPLTVSTDATIMGLGTVTKVSDTIVASIRNDSGATPQYMRFFEISDTTITAIGTEYYIGDATGNGDDTSIAELVPGKYVCFNQDLARTPIIVTCTDFYKERIGVANADAAKDAAVTITLVGREASEWTGLTAGAQYRAHNDGTATVLETGTNREFGVAINTTDIMLR